MEFPIEQAEELVPPPTRGILEVWFYSALSYEIIYTRHTTGNRMFAYRDFVFVDIVLNTSGEDYLMQ